jgi:hypothetical protein
MHVTPPQTKNNIAWLSIFLVSISIYYGIILSVDDFWYLLYSVGPIRWSILATYLVTALTVIIPWIWYNRELKFRWILGLALIAALILLPFPSYIWAVPGRWTPMSPDFWELAIYAHLRVTAPILLMLPLGAANTKAEYRTILIILLLSLLLTLFYRYYTGLYTGVYWTNGKIILNITGGFLISMGLGALLVPLGRIVTTRPAGIDLRS